MNERIKELAIEAGMIIGDASEFDMAKFMPKEVKFAELIVRECVDTMYKRGETYAHPSAGFHQAKTFSEAIIKHFGVEE
jgi:hypothetical protein